MRIVRKSVYFLSLLLATVFNTLINLDAQDLDSIHFFIEQYEYQKAIDIIDRIAEYEKTPKLVDLKVISLKELHKYQEALPYLENLYMQDSSNVERITDLANCYLLLGNFKSAQRLYKKALSQIPGNNYVIQQLANSYFQLDDFEESKKYYLSAYTIDSTFYLARQLGKCYENLDMIDTAIYYYKISLATNPFDFESTYRLANLYKLGAEYSEGIILTDTFLQQDSTNFKILRLSGFLHFLNKSYDISVKRFENCIAIGDVSEFVIKYLGYSYFKTNEFELAKDYLERAYLKDTLNADLCYTLGLSCDYSVYKKLGIYYLNKTIELVTPTPDFLSQVYQDLATANTGYYKYNDALDAYLTAYELTPNDTLLIFKIARHYDNWLKDKKTALIYYQKFMDTRPENNKPLPKMPGVMVLSYYDFVERRMVEIREEMFWEEK
jgi:tetratricopeptide (TPR) repeat protein